MEPRPHTPPPPPPPPNQQLSIKVNCSWCNQPMDSAATNCPSCGKLRKDIYNDQMVARILSFIGFILILIGLFSKGSTLIVLDIIGLLFACVGLYFYSKASNKLKKWVWI